MALYMIVEQYGEMRDEWKPFQGKSMADTLMPINIFTSKKTAICRLEQVKKFYPKKDFILRRIYILLK